ncbi:DUF2147 domain-containing protein [Cognatiyoonia sp. IB215182]|uniref:DUF2147 domain-containing protein n=1 Tax=Cognatiyoonia sp. IB215182 TaxID=3097353 RepID=UPI002A137D19|nr:DUF2147 domain-containing protein [Cognatiyoonia sp. IB215182]MDX8351273.1 DUF2147 domain-containing protein [Cognatiyoonia sp. IB215182]
MKTLKIAAAALIALSTSAFADPLEGRWQTARDDNGNSGIIQVAPCGNALCGRLVQSFDASGNTISTEHDGRMIISEMLPQGGGAYRGKIYAPDRDRTYNSRLQLSGNSLAVSGCVFGICRDGGTWTRAN